MKNWKVYRQREFEDSQMNSTYCLGSWKAVESVIERVDIHARRLETGRILTRMFL